MKTLFNKPTTVAASSRLKFALIYEKYSGKIYKYFWFRSGQNAEEAEDLTQETFLRAFKSLPEYEDRGVPYFFYLLTIARNLLVNFYRKPKPVQLDENIDIPDTTIKDFSQQNDVDNLWRAVKSLNRSERLAMMLRYREDMQIKEIAQKMKKSENAVKLILSRGRKKLTKHPALRKTKQDDI